MTEQLPQEGTPTEGQEPEDAEQQGTSLDDLAALKAELNKARREAARYRTEAKKAADADEQRKREEMSELERMKADMAKLQQSAQDAEQRAKQAMIKAAVMRAANGFNDPEDALRLIDIAALEVADDGEIVGLQESIAKLLKDKPYLAKTTKGSISPTNPQGGPQGESDAQRRARLFGNTGSPIWQTDGGVLIRE